MNVAIVSGALNSMGKALLEEALQAVRAFFRPLWVSVEVLQQIPAHARTAASALRNGLTRTDPVVLTDSGMNFIPSKDFLRLEKVARRAVRAVRGGWWATWRARSGERDSRDLWVIHAFLMQASDLERTELWSLIYLLKSLSHAEMEARHFELTGGTGVRLTVSRAGNLWIVERVDRAPLFTEESPQG